MIVTDLIFPVLIDLRLHATDKHDVCSCLLPQLGASSPTRILLLILTLLPNAGPFVGIGNKLHAAALDELALDILYEYVSVDVLRGPVLDLTDDDNRPIPLAYTILEYPVASEKASHHRFRNLSRVCVVPSSAQISGFARSHSPYRCRTT